MICLTFLHWTRSRTRAPGGCVPESRDSRQNRPLGVHSGKWNQRYGYCLTGKTGYPIEWPAAQAYDPQSPCWGKARSRSPEQQGVFRVRRVNPPRSMVDLLWTFHRGGSRVSPPLVEADRQWELETVMGVRRQAWSTRTRYRFRARQPL